MAEHKEFDQGSSTASTRPTQPGSAQRRSTADDRPADPVSEEPQKSEGTKQTSSGIVMPDGTVDISGADN